MANLINVNEIKSLMFLDSISLIAILFVFPILKLNIIYKNTNFISVFFIRINIRNW